VVSKLLRLGRDRVSIPEHCDLSGRDRVSISERRDLFVGSCVNLRTALVLFIGIGLGAVDH